MDTQLTTFKQYTELCLRTWNQIIPHEQRIEHALLGLMDELGEIANFHKKHIGYGRPHDIVNLKEEVGDLMYYSAVYAHELEFTDRLPKDLFTDAPQPNIPVNYTITKSLASAMFFVNVLEDEGRDTQALSGIINNVKYICNVFNISLKECLELNYAKLYQRYAGQGFSADKAINRDTDAERAILDNTQQ